MRSILRPLICATLSTFFVLLLTACGLTISDPGLFAGDATKVSIAITGLSTVTLGAQSQYAATVTGSSDGTVTWSVNGVAGGDATNGSITKKGLYIAPASAPQSSQVTITATSVAAPSVSNSLAVALAAQQKYPTGESTVTLTLSGATTVSLANSSQYSAIVTGSPDTDVTWSVDGVVGGNATAGSISEEGLYTAPASAPPSSQVTITAASVASPTVSQSLTVALVTPPEPPASGDGGSAVTLTLSGAASVTLGDSSQYAATVTGSSDTAVNWSVDGVIGGDATVGSISTNGLYKAPAAAPSSLKVTITATSQADPSVAQSLAVALVAPETGGGAGGDPTVTLALSGATTVTLGASSQYAATVTGSTNKAVTWSVDGVVGGDDSVGLISAKGLYKAPATAPQSSKVTITATSVADPTVAQSLAVTLAAPAKPPVITLSLTGATTVTLGNSSQYAATVSGSTNKTVTWSVNGVAGGNVTRGSISAAGRYTAPAKAPGSSKVTITATSVADPSVAQSLAVTLVAPPPPPITLSLTGATTVTLGNSSQYAATVTGSTNKAVTWSVNGVVGGSATLGAISAAGRYTAPAKAPGSSKVTITATSQADPTVAQSLAVALAAPAPPPITLTLTGAATVTLGTSSQYVATVTGSSAGVTWSVNGVAGGNATTGSISAKGLYTAPTGMPNSSTVTITATTVANPLIAKSLVTTLVGPVSPSGRIPANAISTGNLESSTKWQWHHDSGTPGNSQGSTVYPVMGYSPDDAAREFYMTYSAKGGELYSLHFGSDTTATHFVYDTYVYVVDPSQLANLEMDINDVMADGRTVILGTQCSGYAKTWEFTAIVNGKSGWHPSNIPCNPANWAAKTWHHIQIASHRDSNGVATYDWVSFDGTYSDFHGAVGPSGRSLGWQKGTLLLNFQIDGSSKGSGSNTLYMDRLTIYRW
jgi:hypothetical protein